MGLPQMLTHGRLNTVFSRIRGASAPAPSHPADRRGLFWATAAFLVAVLLHVDHVPLWASFAAFVCAGWRVAAAVRPIRLPGRTLKTVLTIMMLIAVLLMFRTLNGLAAGSALLVAMGAIKLLETGSRRDQFITVGAALFLLLAACLERQTLLRTPLYLVHAWLCCTAFLVAAHPRSSLGNRDAALLTARSLLYALPLAVLLFLFFPRLPGSFWVLQKGTSAVTGLGESMSPGSISQLTDSDDIAFRVWFLGDIPPSHERYWRGPVLHDFDGYTWTRPRGRFYRQEHIDPIGKGYRYRVALEPHSQQWWFSLDTITDPPHGRVLVTYDHQLISTERVNEVTTYEATSHTRTRSPDPISLLAQRYDTALPKGRNPRANSLAIELRQKAASEAEFVRSVLELFRKGGFEYTLTPPLLNLNSVDDFIFNTRRGFCGHYASAFVMMMRSAGVPARVVTGYLGGEWNPIGRYFVVKQSDAHAWAEIWVDGQGWTRVDPTAVVAPERLQRGILELLPDAGSAPARLIRNTPWLMNVQLVWDALNAWWDQDVVGFDFRLQLSILDKLGFDAPGWQQLGWAFTTGLAGWLLWLTWQISREPRNRREDRITAAYRKLCDKLAGAGVTREAHIGPLAFAEIVAAQRPDLVGNVHPLLMQYANLRFGVEPDPASVSEFERAVSRVRFAAKHGGPHA
jgi:protein-glutamine gamma-glutamyltransferase